MTTTPLASRPPSLIATRPPTTQARWPSACRIDYASSTVHHALAEAPVGGCAMLEAAFAWQLLRPAERPATGDARPAAGAPRHLPIVETRSEALAARVARLLSGLAWAIVTHAGAEDGDLDRPPVARVQVPRMPYHRVLRALTGAWRDARRQFDPQSQAGAAETGDTGAAVALWRMGILATGPGPRRDMIYLHTGTVPAAEMLAVAATRLGLTPEVDLVRGDPAVALYHPGEVHWLLAEAGAGDAATVWARGGPARLAI